MEKTKAIFTLILGGIAVLLLIVVIFSIVPGLISISGGKFETKGSVIKFTLLIVIVEFFAESFITALYKVFTDNKAIKNSFVFFVVKTISLFFIALVVGYLVKGVYVTTITAVFFALLYATISYVIETILDNALDE